MAIFKYENEFRKQLVLEKQIKKMGSFVCFSCLLPELWSLDYQKLSLIVKKSKAVIAIYIASESFRSALFKSGIVYYAVASSLQV